MSIGFANLAILSLAAVAIPPLIHLLNRRRYDIVDWGAMQFLEVSQTTRRRMMLEELLLMALRMDPVRLLIADDVGIGKTVESALIARELLDSGVAKRLCVLCPPHLAEQWQGEGRQRQSGGEQPGVGEQQLDGEGGQAEAGQGHQQRLETAEPVVVGFRQGAGDHPEEQRDHQLQVVEEPADGHHPTEGDEHPQAVGELVQRPEAPQGVEHRRGLHVQRGLPDVSRSD